MGSSVRNSYVSTLCPVVICPYLCTSDFTIYLLIAVLLHTCYAMIWLSCRWPHGFTAPLRCDSSLHSAIAPGRIIRLTQSATDLCSHPSSETKKHVRQIQQMADMCLTIAATYICLKSMETRNIREHVFEQTCNSYIYIYIYIYTHTGIGSLTLMTVRGQISNTISYWETNRSRKGTSKVCEPYW